MCVKATQPFEIGRLHCLEFCVDYIVYMQARAVQPDVVKFQVSFYMYALTVLYDRIFLIHNWMKTE